jgi:Cu(I)/Ag(I) efflux system membrane protein CusA/SilA
MIEALIRWSVANRFLVLLATLFVTAAGVWSLRITPIDALPDLSDVQVIIRTGYPGQAPQIVENQVTYPLVTTMLSVPGAKTVRGYSFFGDSFVYISTRWSIVPASTTWHSCVRCRTGSCASS